MASDQSTLGTDADSSRYPRLACTSSAFEQPMITRETHAGSAANAIATAAYAPNDAHHAHAHTRRCGRREASLSRKINQR